MGRVTFLSVLALCLAGYSLAAEPAVTHGPYNVEIPAGGDGLTFPVDMTGASSLQYGYARSHAIETAKIVLLPAADWTLSAWVKPSEIAKCRVVIGGLGDLSAGRFLTMEDGKLAVWNGSGEVASNVALAPDAWRFIAAVQRGGKVRLYVDGKVATEGVLASVPALSQIQLGPRGNGAAYAGKIAGFTDEDRALDDAGVTALAAKQPDFGLIVFTNASPTWSVQTHQMYGQESPQDPWTLPKSRAQDPFTAPVAKPPYAGPALEPKAAGTWKLAKWSLQAAPQVDAQGALLSRPGYDASKWYPATVPGTVLQTLIDRGVYPDPDFGLNNLVIPESLHAKDYWYRTEFVAPAGRHFSLTFNGVNYAAEVWVNGMRVGEMKGAFARGRFDVSALLKPGALNAIAVKVSPVPHPGIAEEESLAAGVGENGGMEALDGPTFIASEGWDWIPSVRDRNTGLWQDVMLQSTGDVRIGDAQIVTTLPKADNSIADIEVDVPVTNVSRRAVRTNIRISFDDVVVEKSIRLAPGDSVVKLTPADFPQLSVPHPRLWWPNGYGAPALHTMHIAMSAGHGVSDAKDIRFGMRQITYNLSLMDDSGHLDRVNLDFSKARQLGQQIVDVRHEAIRKIANGWVYSLTPGAQNSAAVHASDDAQLSPYLVIKVNGVKIAARGGSWGTDDWLKRIGRARLEPFFRLHRDAHVNIIRNWVGQNTEPVFYDLADEYGILVLNDFWESTQNYQLEAEDVPLFLANAADTIARYRNHPSILLWFGRNEGVPQPVLNKGLEKLVRELDGTRIYMPSSNTINLHDSGPYDYRDPVKYFTEYSRGFAVEVGTPSFPTLEAFEAMVPKADRWPADDVWAYHDWHPNGNGATKNFTDAMAAKFGTPVSLEDFDRKAQMMNFETYRAIFEGMNAGLWTTNSGRLLWMTQPSWPSTNWQILSHDYDTHAAYYGFKTAAEPVHVQMDMPDHRLAVINNGLEAIPGVTIHAQIYALDGRRLAVTDEKIDAAANAVTNGQVLDFDAALKAEGVVVVELSLDGQGGKALSRNLYWVARDDAASRKLANMKPQPVSLRATAARDGDEIVVTGTLRDDGIAPALEAKMTLENAQGARILPAYYDDNYISLLPGEERSFTIRYPASAGKAQIALRGWNVRAAVAPVAGQ